MSTKYNREEINNIPQDVYRAWGNMKTRCYNKNYTGYKNYGGRGIAVCKRWLESSSNFYLDMSKRPNGASLNRINNSANYSPQNCVWSSRLEQARNRRNTRFIRYRGEVKTIREWALLLDIDYFTLYRRLNKYGMSTERALFKAGYNYGNS